MARKRRHSIWLRPIAIAALCACSSSAPKQDGPKPGADADAQFSARANSFYQWHVENTPGWSVRLGFHQYDGILPDVSADAFNNRLAVSRAALSDLEAMSGLSDEREYERQILLHNLRETIFEIDVLRAPYRNPMSYAGELGFTQYISRDYAPADVRAKAIVKACSQAGRYYQQAQKNLEDVLPKTMVETALLIARGTVSFLEDDVPKAMASIGEAELAALRESLTQCTTALEGYISLLEKRLEKATDEFAIGKEAFLAMLAGGEGLEVPLERLEEIGNADLERNLASLRMAAEKLAPGKPLADAIALSVNDKPAPGEVLAEATAQSDRMKQFLIDKEIVSIPTDDVAELRETPPFLRWNFAFLSSPGPFESKPLPSFYYISPPDPTWSEEVQRAYIASKSDLLFVTIHEVWPGHFLHGLHSKMSTSKIARSFCSYAMSEGWAHYTEEMMWDAGVGDGDPKVHIGQLQNALLRNVRYVSAIGLHVKGMSVAESKAMFIEKGMQDEGNASQQAVRGTFDPGYLNYTLGKLMIRKLHEDWKVAKGAEYSIKAFHDEFLRWQCAPVPVIRRMMLGEDAGAPL